MCRGVGDPLVAAYIRCYMCRVNNDFSRKRKGVEWYLVCFQVTIDIDFKHRIPIEIAFLDFCDSCHQLNTETVKHSYTAQKLKTSVYLSLYSPALDWIMQCYLHNFDEKKIGKLINKARAGLNAPR